MPSMLPVTDETFAAEVLASEKPVLVDIWATWCGPCRMVAPVVEQIAAEHADSLRVVKLNYDENPRVGRDYQVMSVPTLLLFRDGEVIRTIVGAKPKAALLRELEAVL
ncbi:thioredoxin [Herbihabitans rhizosphaerae]|uniref:Thioredoxin n=1 Tax=Herbihabitans rhizosphaerae TaxID=1872711 RepID=A0A4Q7L719_9PSEU|nr:thioredoxin [Herbihabitans rhizosphaerae]RZS45175.1 thioredoxin [Herbihabitans rhizosphaerae]